MKTLYQQNFWHLHVCNKLYYVQQHEQLCVAQGNL